MSGYRQILYHLVFRTKDKQKTILLEHSKELYACLMGIIRNLLKMNIRRLLREQGIAMKEKYFP